MSSVSSAAKQETAVDVIPSAAATAEKGSATNPLHVHEGAPTPSLASGDVESGKRTTQVPASASATVTALAAIKSDAAAVNKGHVKIRQWILDSIPDIEPATMHVLAKQLEKVGIQTYGDLEDCVRSNVVNVADIKGYIDTAGILRKKAVGILNEVERMAAASKHTEEL